LNSIDPLTRMTASARSWAILENTGSISSGADISAGHNEIASASAAGLIGLYRAFFDRGGRVQQKRDTR
jgi:hypothetical protein